MRSHLLALTTIGVLAIIGGSARAQNPPPAAHPNLSGAWALDSSISDDPARANFEPPADASRTAGRGGRFGFGRGGFQGRFGGGRESERTADAFTADERARLQALTDEIRRSSGRFTIAHDDPNLAITDLQGHVERFQTDGRAGEYRLASTTVPTTSHWMGSRLVAEYDLGGTHKLISTYTLLEKTEQLVVRIRLAGGDQSRAMGPEEKFVYSLMPAR